MTLPTLILDKIWSTTHSWRTLQPSRTDPVTVHVGLAGGVQVAVVARLAGDTGRGSGVGVVPLVTDDGVHIASPWTVVSSCAVQAVRDILPLDLVIVFSSTIDKKKII